MSLFSRPKAWLCLTLLVGTLTSSAAMAQSDELGSLREAREAAQARDQARLQSFLEDQDGLEAALEEARAAHEAAEEEQAALEAQQDEQSEQAQALAQRQEEQGEALTSLLADLARHSEEIRNELGGDSWLTLEADALPPRLNDVDVLERSQIEAVVDSLATLTVNTGRAERLELPVADASGDIESHSVVRLGDFAAFTESALLRKGQDEESSLAEVPRTPTAISDLLAAYHQGESREFAIDPTQGSVLEALAQQPTLWERFQQGGYVGYVVVVLGGIGLLVALAQYIYLLTVSARVRRQRQNLDQPSKDNPLGRVLERFKEMDKHQTPEALEARLDEAVLAELPKIERGQPIVKLLAAIAPLLGLLGTVTGMINTFQAITLFGTGDPKLMAGGISQALVTTVLGLVVAIPMTLLFATLHTRSKNLIHILQEQASGIIAERSERGE